MLFKKFCWLEHKAIPATSQAPNTWLKIYIFIDQKVIEPLQNCDHL